ncbi:pyridoxal phosphate-dependent decarboxylase family protein [Fulvivirga ligni]|uniref:pyridoxal phosphate-dependent decarboxylase family protein n=1 Tax=Fulvivirga ligni TaxID=2904246 RepID=UPI001F3510CA|nr:aspartate aminotransferase family protein [Fulvivirga ligni]UII19035.1 aspartate aminotransferase family protein [Fulvivirga ligni]
MLQKSYAHQLLDGLTKDQLYKYIFSELPENKAYYQKSMNQAVNAIVEHLENRNEPFSGASLEEVKVRFSKIFIDDTGYGATLHEVLDELKELYLNDAISFHNRKYVAHLNCPILTPALAAEVIISSINTSMDTWDQSAGGTFIELKLIDWTLNKIGYPVDSDGIFTSGGTQSNMMGLLLARDHFIHQRYKIDPKVDGLPPEATRFRIFCSEVSHFSLKKNAALLGLGQKSIVSVPVNEYYQMDTHTLIHAIEKERLSGNIPIAIVGTAGTTDFSSIDPLSDIAEVAETYNLWFHVDAAYGGGLVLSDKHCYKLKGIELSDSATIDYHKTFFQPVSSSGFFMRNKTHVDYIKYHADYLNSKEQEEEGLPNMVKKSIQTTRRFDALKLWMTLRMMGRKKLGQYIDDIIYLAQQTALMLRERGKFEVLNQPEISAIVFRYNPIPGTRIDLCSVNAHIRKAMFNEGKALIASTKVKGQVYLKFTLLNPLTELKDLEEIADIIQKHGEEYFRNN